MLFPDLVIFDNSYSWTRSKNVYYDIELVKPDKSSDIKEEELVQENEEKQQQQKEEEEREQKENREDVDCFENWDMTLENKCEKNVQNSTTATTRNNRN